jgi:hypothetical protein
MINDCDSAEMKVIRMATDNKLESIIYWCQKQDHSLKSYFDANKVPLAAWNGYEYSNRQAVQGVTCSKGFGDPHINGTWKIANCYIFD